ncbi:hypothetical protein BH18ACT2_BH18ACT2_08080 [soil metagenome]
MRRSDNYALDAELFGEPVDALPSSEARDMTPVDHLAAVLGDGPGWVFVAAGTEPKFTATGKVEHGRWTEQPFRWPADADAIGAHVAADPDADWYFTPSMSENPVRKLSAEPGRYKKALRKCHPVTVLWSDCDDSPNLERVGLLVGGGAWRVASGGADRFHLYVPLVEPAGADLAGELLDRLAHWLHADVSVARHGAYLRLAGTHNQKPKVRGDGPPVAVAPMEVPCLARWTAGDLDDLLPDAPAPPPLTIDVPVEKAPAEVPALLALVIDEAITDEMDRSARTMAAVGACVDAGLGNGEVLAMMRRHAPTVDKYGTGDRFVREVVRALGKVRGARPSTLLPATQCSLDQAHAVAQRWLGDEYDLDALDVTLAAAAVERLNGDPVWMLVISGSGNAKTETVQAFGAAGAHVTSTITSVGALLSASPRKEKAKDATGGLLRKVGDHGVIVIKDITSILSMDRNGRAEVLAALREVYDGRWERNVGTDGGRTLTWAGRITVIGAVTTAWDRAHDVISAMGDRFVLLRMDSTEGRMQAGRRSIGNTGAEIQMRAELGEAVAGVLAGVDPETAIDLDDDETERLLTAADIVTIGRTAVDYDYRGDVIDAHAPEMPTRFAKQLAQVVRGGVAIGLDRADAMRLAVRCARDSMPPLRLAILLDVAAHPRSTTTEVRKRIDKPRASVDRQLQSLHMLGLLDCEEPESYSGKGTQWRYSVSDGVDPSVLDPTITRFVTNYTQGHKKERGETPFPTTHISGDGPVIPQQQASLL